MSDRNMEREDEYRVLVHRHIIEALRELTNSFDDKTPTEVCAAAVNKLQDAQQLHKILKQFGKILENPRSVW